MLYFRSGEHLDHWLQDWHMPRGEILPLAQCWQLANAWYGPDRREAAWRRRTIEEAEALFAELGLISPFWGLRG